MNMALITGITGQNGSYLAGFPLEKDCEVSEINSALPRSSTHCGRHIYHQDPQVGNARIDLHYGNLSDASNSTRAARILQEVSPNDIYNLGTHHHVAVHFASPEYTTAADAMGILRVLEAICILSKKEETHL